ncbi:hypothetical protein [Alicyclobacillus acidiphilus]|uniref:hypothetical protein n=1 Tax=Alicyclobacillus acidiphilus TaxID=182455 RepID=UPI000ADC797C|nr:hypothetical protein [Alicyclobacillus acidiphilus]
MNDVKVRRLRVSISAMGSNEMHWRNPWISAFWSFAYPGCGHLLQGRILRGLILIVWELVVNGFAKVNLSIMYSLQGNFELAKQVVNLRWLLLYVSLYVYAIWDSYRGTVDINKQYVLADREDAPLRSLRIKTLDMNFLDRRNPWYAATLSLLAPGLGHLYVRKVVVGVFFLAWTIVVMLYSHALPAVHETMIGHFDNAKSMVDMQWLMYLPSIYGFVIHNTFVTAVEHNKLFEKEQSKFLREHYQRPDFKMPL